MATKTIKKMNLKILLLIDRKTNKVVFAEADKEFVDFIIHILSLPLSTVVKLLNEQGMLGCLADLYNSIDSLNTNYFEPNFNIYSLLNPKPPLSFAPFLSFNNNFNNNNNTTTPQPQDYVKEAVAYLVMDNLEVKPMSISVIKSYANYDFASLEEKHVQLGLQEAIAMLKASLETKNVLTAVFLEQKSSVLSCGIGCVAVIFGVLHGLCLIATNWSTGH